MKNVVHTTMKVISLLFLIALVLAVGVVVFVVVGPILLEIDILAEPTYTKLEDFLRRMLLYIIAFAIGYVVFSWGRHLSEPKEEELTKPSPAPSSSPPSDEASPAPSPSPADASQSSSSHAYRPEVVPPGHP